MDITRLKALLDEIEAEQEVILTRLQLLEPIIVYQMGKVASTTVCETLKNHGFKNILHAHSINPALISKKKHKEMKRGVNRFFLHETAGMYIAATGLVHKSKVISLVRDPVARNISAFFQNYQFKHEDFGYKGKRFIDELTLKFMENYPHQYPLKWFDGQFKKSTGVDIFDYPFNSAQGYQIIETDRIPLLIMQTELNDQAKIAALEKFLNISNLRIFHANLSDDKDYQEIYQNLLKRIKLPVWYLDMMYQSKYAHHFYSEKVIQSFRLKWER